MSVTAALLRSLWKAIHPPSPDQLGSASSPGVFTTGVSPDPSAFITWMSRTAHSTREYLRLRQGRACSPYSCVTCRPIRKPVMRRIPTPSATSGAPVMTKPSAAQIGGGSASDTPKASTGIAHKKFTSGKAAAHQRGFAKPMAMCANANGTRSQSAESGAPGRTPSDTPANRHDSTT